MDPRISSHPRQSFLWGQSKVSLYVTFVRKSSNTVVTKALDQALIITALLIDHKWCTTHRVLKSHRSKMIMSPSARCHKAIVVITGRAHCFHDNIHVYIYIYIWNMKKFQMEKKTNILAQKLFRNVLKNFCANIVLACFHLKFLHRYSYCLSA